MTLKTWILLGIVEQIVMFAYILPIHGYWFSFFGHSIMDSGDSASDTDDHQNTASNKDESKGK